MVVHAQGRSSSQGQRQASKGQTSVSMYPYEEIVQSSPCCGHVATVFINAAIQLGIATSSGCSELGRIRID